MSKHNDQLIFKRWAARTEQRIKNIEKGTTETRPAPRFVNPPPGPWQPLGYYLAPHWKGIQNISGLAFGDDDEYNDLTASDYIPRFYLDRDRVWLGGCIEFDKDRVGESNIYGPPGDTSPSSTTDASTIFQYMPLAYAPRYGHHFRIPEDKDFTLTGWIWEQMEAFVVTDNGLSPRCYMGFLNLLWEDDPASHPGYPKSDPIKNGTVLCLDNISWRVS